MKNLPLCVAGLIFAFVSGAHIYRYFKHFEVVVGTFHFPAEWSIYAAAVSGLLALWMFVAAAK